MQASFQTGRTNMLSIFMDTHIVINICEYTFSSRYKQANQMSFDDHGREEFNPDPG